MGQEHSAKGKGQRAKGKTASEFHFCSFLLALSSLPFALGSSLVDAQGRLDLPSSPSMLKMPDPRAAM